MKIAITLVSVGQVRILSEGVAQPWQPLEPLPDELEPRTRFTDEQIRAGLPTAQRFGLSDLVCFGKSAKGGEL